MLGVGLMVLVPLDQCSFIFLSSCMYEDFLYFGTGLEDIEERGIDSKRVPDAFRSVLHAVSVPEMTWSAPVIFGR